MEENIIRRERLQKLQKKRLIESMRAALPVYDMEQIRKYKLPYHEALLTNLEDKGYVSSSDYIKQLCQFQQNIREKAGRLSQIWGKPQLRFSRDELTQLSDLLVKVEDYHNDRCFAEELEMLLQTAVHFAFSGENWWWLGEQLLIQCLVTAEEYKFLGDQYQALTRYVYGKFLLENFAAYESAERHLKIARELSNGRDWSLKVLFPLETDTMFLRSNYLLYLCLINQVEKLMETDNVTAGRMAVIARKRAAEACYAEGEIKALMLKGMCQLSCNDTKGGIVTFTKAFYIQAKLGLTKGMCETRIHIARAYLLDGNSQLSMNTLLLLRESAEEFNLPFYLAQSYRHLGELFLNNGEAWKATPLLTESLKLFHENGYIKESEQARNLEAVSTGLELFPEYIDLLCNTDKEDNMMRLIDWKDSRLPFIGEAETNDNLEVEVIIQESLAEVRGIRDYDKSVKIDDEPKILGEED